MDGSVACVLVNNMGDGTTRMFAQDPAFYRKVRVDETDDPEALRRLMELEAIDAIRRWFTLAEALSALGVGRSTHYERKR